MLTVVPARTTQMASATSPHRSHLKLAAAPRSIRSPNLVTAAAVTPPVRCVRAVEVTADGSEPFFCFVELAHDHAFDVVPERGVRAQDELAEHGQQGPVLAGAPGQARPGGVEEADGVVGEVGYLDHPRPRAVAQAPCDVLAVLLVLVAAGSQVGLVTSATSSAVRAPNWTASTASASRRLPLGAMSQAWSSTVSCSSSRTPRPGRDAVVAEDPDRNPQRMTRVRLTLPPVQLVQPRHQRQSGLNPGAVRAGEPPSVDQQPLAQPVFPVHGGDRVQRHRGQQPHFRRTQPRPAGGLPHGLLWCHGLTFPCPEQLVCYRSNRAFPQTSITR